MNKLPIVFALSLTIAFMGFALAGAAGCDPSKLEAVAAYQKSDAVVNLQSCLIDAGFGIPAGATGYYGAQTIGAVKAFYSSWYGGWNGLKVGPQGIANLRNNSAPIGTGSEGFKTFVAAADFKIYFQKAIQETSDNHSRNSLGGGSGMATAMDGLGSNAGGSAKSISAPTAAGAVLTDRASATNVQVAGIDEPDIVKTDGKEIYYSGSSPIYWWGAGGGISATDNVSRCYDCQSANTKAIKALPLNDMAVDANIKKSGDLLLFNNVLAVFGDGGVTGYNVADPENPIETWNIKPEGNASIIGSRLRNGKIYMVAKTTIGTTDICPIRPLTIGGVGVSIACDSIYHPERVLPTNAIFSVFVINAANGAVEQKTSFAGLGDSSVIYMSPENLFITYPAYESEFDIHAGLIKENMKDLVSASLVDQIVKLESYDIGSSAKMVELDTILNNYENGLSSDNRLRFENEMQNRLAEYRKTRLRNFDKTVVAKIGLGDLKFYAAGSVPGQPLNQFSLDEYNGNLRIATTVGSSWFMRSETANDVYVLDPEMKISGSALDLGKTEKIYSARFIEDKGYIVTFRQTDPFYVIDLKDPKNPKLAGELKIPGYSGYLHPVNKDRIIGIGMEDSNVKISYFNVSDPAHPAEMDKYSLKEYWSEAVSNHHAFLMDGKHGIFFMPGSNGGYVFSYLNDKLSLLKAVSGINPNRAIYINDYLYMIGGNKIAVLDENTWEKVKEFNF